MSAGWGDARMADRGGSGRRRCRRGQRPLTVLAALTHELREPMNGVLGMTRLLAETELSPEQRGCVEAITASAEALLTVINDMLDLARAEAGQAVEYPLLAEVTNLYADEHAQALRLLGAINARVATPLPPTEAVGLALHLVNAGFATGALAFSYTMTGLSQQFLDVVAGAHGVALEPGGVSVGRFVTHLRYLFVRVHQRRQLDDAKHSAEGDAIRATYPEAVDTADRLARLVEVRLQAALTPDEVAYLALHVARVVQDAEQAA